jgi:DNA helicase II / ATP-dependent DNA helicase PcrA
MEITDRDIERVSLLLFNDKDALKDEKGERYEFIKCIDRSVDVHACPGSGKTTCLIAKMYLLSEKMPFPDGRGICVLTHTNVAIDTIKKKLGDLGDKLFRHPNFFGTFQTFVDRFLAIPVFKELYGVRPTRIDNDIWYANLWSRYSKLKRNERSWLYRRAKLAGKSEKDIAFQYFIDNIRIKIIDKDNFVFIDGLDWQKTLLKNPKSDTYRAVYSCYHPLFMSGILSFDDAYSLAHYYLNHNRTLSELFSSRFKMVFIDEMQDTYKHQSEIINKLFTKDVVIQRIGDLNQSILGDNESETNWKKEGDYLEISGSRRFSQAIANTLRTVAFEPQSNLTGKNSSENLPPYIIPYEQGKENLVLDDFARLIRHYNLDTKAYKTGNPIKAVGWIGKEKEGLTIGSYFKGYSKKMTNPRNFPNLITLLACSIDVLPKKFRNRLLTAILDVLHIEGIKQPGLNRHFTQSSFLDFLDNQFPNMKTKFETRMAWFHMMVNKKPAKLEQIHQKACKFLTNFIEMVFSAEFKYGGKRFIEDVEIENIELTSGATPNVYYSEIHELKHIPIHVATVHSVKGETHTATLYLETYYQGKTCGEYSIEQLKGVPFVNNGKQKRKSQCIKVAHVGLSRPTDLLCFAMNKKLLDEHQESLRANGWEIYNVV